MTTLTELGETAQQQILSSVEAMQTIVLDSAATFTNAVGRSTPGLPEIDLPYADQLPSAADAVRLTFDFADKLLATQRAFAEKLVVAVSPPSS